MQLVRFDPTQDIPLVDAVIYGPRKSQNVRLVFDTGTGLTSIDTPIIESIGYSAKDAIQETSVRGPIGDEQSGYTVPTKCLSIFGMRVSNLVIAAHDFDNFQHWGINGLLGFDVIKKLHLEMNGPEGLLKFFSADDRSIVEQASKLAEKEPAHLKAEDIRVLLNLARISTLC